MLKGLHKTRLWFMASAKEIGLLTTLRAGAHQGDSESGKWIIKAKPTN